MSSLEKVFSNDPGVSALSSEFETATSLITHDDNDISSMETKSSITLTIIGIADELYSDVLSFATRYATIICFV